MTANDGTNLEAAAEAIERLILTHRTDLAGEEIVVIPRKREIINGVLHEFDLWVSVGDTELYLVECKDWNTAVGKNEVIIFTEKLRVTKANGGYMVARSFGKYAQAQASLWDGLRLQIFNQDIASLTTLPSLTRLTRQSPRDSMLSCSTTTRNCLTQRKGLYIMSSRCPWRRSPSRC